MAKQGKTRPELTAMIVGQLGHVPLYSIRVYPDDVYGWYVVCVGNPDYIEGIQTRADEIAANLRINFDLIE